MMEFLMSSFEVEILCGSCKCPAQTVADAKPQDKVTCPRCNRSDTIDNVRRIVGEHVAYETSRMLSESLARATRGNSFLKLTPQRQPQRTFRWIAG